jgi:cobalt-zinc-cadmium efflux system protein
VSEDGGHDHGHNHDHHHDHGYSESLRRNHDHSHSHNHNDSKLGWALTFTLLVMLLQAVGGWWANSLALMSDAGHMAVDAAALALAWFAQFQSRRKPDAVFTYGKQRYRVLAAFINGLALFGLTLWIAIEAVFRFLHPEAVDVKIMLVIASIGLLCNVLVLKMLHSHQHDLNVRAVIAHALSDVLGSVAAILAALLVWWKGWLWADPVLSMFATLLILRSAWRITQESARVLVEATPQGFDRQKVADTLVPQIAGLVEIHHVHAWMLTQEYWLITLHARIQPEANSDSVLAAIQAQLQAQGFAHSTVQIERVGCGEVGCG